jgi:uncharacterized protein (DUF885 family)
MMCSNGRPNSGCSGLQPDMLALTVVRPVDHFYGFHTFYPGFASGEGAAPFKTVADYQNNLQRHREYIAMIDAWIVRFREGMKTGVVQPKLIVNNVIDQMNLQIGQGVEGSTFYGPVKTFPEGISAADQARLKAEYAAIIKDGIIPAYTRLRDFLKTDYLPVARDSVGLSGMKGGDRLYAYMIESNTTLPLKAEDVHQLGLSEVARITKEMETIKTQVGYKGSLADFFVYLRTDPKFQPPSKEWLRDTYFAIGKKVDQRIPEQFALIPKSPLEIKAVEPYREKTDAGGSYQQGTPDGSRPGTFYYNSYDLPSRTTRAWRRSICTRRSPAIISRSAWRRKTRRCPRSCGSAATPPSSRAGRSMPRRCGRIWAWRPIPISGSAA